MSQFYSNPSRENDPHVLPDCESYYFDPKMDPPIIDDEGNEAPKGWYWWHCFPGCLPSGDPVGPFDTEQQAIDYARDNLDTSLI